MAKEIVLDGDLKSILKALSKMKDPVGNSEIEKASGIEKSKLASKMKKLKDAGLVDSPERCKYCITASGKQKL
jgi:predicted transcriptional regulator